MILCVSFIVMLRKNFALGVFALLVGVAVGRLTAPSKDEILEKDRSERIAKINLRLSAQNDDRQKKIMLQQYHDRDSLRARYDSATLARMDSRLDSICAVCDCVKNPYNGQWMGVPTPCKWKK